MKRIQGALLCCLASIALQGCSNGGKNGNAAGDTAVSRASGAKETPGAVQGMKRSAKTDLQFARASFGALASGQASAENTIDWETFQTMGMKVGTVYTTMPNDEAKTAFRKSFVTNFSSSFKKSGGSAAALKNWRVEKQDGKQTVIAADTPKKTKMTITVGERDGKAKMTALNVG